MASQQGVTEDTELVDLDSLLPVYQVLWARYASNTDLVWRIPTFALTAQSFLIAASVLLATHLAAQLCISVAILGVGGSSVCIMRRIEQTTQLDRALLDQFERRMTNLPSKYRLNHAARGTSRDKQLQNVLDEDLWDSYAKRPLQKPFEKVHPGLFWFTTQTAVSLIGATLPLVQRLH